MGMAQNGQSMRDYSPYILRRQEDLLMLLHQTDQGKK